MKKFIYIFIIILSFPLLLVGCANTGDEVEPVYNTTTYYVYYYFEDASGGAYSNYEIEERTGRIGETVTITEKSYNYYNYNKSSSYYTGTIYENIVFSLYYKRQQFVIRFIDDKTYNEQKAARFGATITLPTRTQEGYTFLGWAYDVEGINMCELTTMPTQNLVLYSVWQAN